MLTDTNNLVANLQDSAQTVLPSLVSSRTQQRIGCESDSDLLGASPQIVKICQTIHSVAATSSTVLLTGETGTGKGVAARVIHNLSKRANRQFVHVDCAALSPTVIESELFGHERGAFTGAVSQRPGRFELADRGTIFLDEIGDLDYPLQAKLLRILQDRAFERIGGSQTIAMNARVIAATARDLCEEMRRGRFRPDLYFRLNVVHIRIPPLRCRLEDVPFLARRVLKAVCERLDVAEPQMSKAFIDQMLKYRWPGNVRELENALESVCLQHPSQMLQPQHLDGVLETSFPVQMLDGQPLGTELVNSFNAMISDEGGDISGREHLRAILGSAGGNIARAARRLRIPRSTLRYWIRRHGLAELLPRD